MAIQSSDVIAGNDILATDLNKLRADLLTNDIAVAGIKSFSSDVYVAATKKIYLDGGSNTYLVENSADSAILVCGDVSSQNWSATQSGVYGDFSLVTTKKLFFDGGGGGGDTYITESSANTLKLVSGAGGTLEVATNININCNLNFSSANKTITLKTLTSQWDLYTDAGTSEFQWKYGGNLRYYFTTGGNGYADAAWLTFSPDIKKDDKYKDKTSLTAKDYLDWALDDANKPIKPYNGIPKLKENDEVAEVDNCIFDTQDEADVEIDKYAKDISKIAIGVAKWAEQAELRIQALEAK